MENGKDSFRVIVWPRANFNGLQNCYTVVALISNFHVAVVRALNYIEVVVI